MISIGLVVESNIIVGLGVEMESFVCAGNKNKIDVAFYIIKENDIIHQKLQSYIRLVLS